MSPNSLILAKLLNKPRPPSAPVIGKTDVVITNIGTGKTAVYLSSLLVECGFEGRILAFGACSLAEQLELQTRVNNWGATNIHVFVGCLQDLSLCDVRLRNVIAVLANCPCSLTAVSCPVEFLCSEGGDASCLVERLVRRDDEKEDIQLMSEGNYITLDHAMKLPRVRTVVYVTYSLHDEENQDVVHRAMCSANSFIENCRSSENTGIDDSDHVCSVSRSVSDTSGGVSFEIVRPCVHIDGHDSSKVTKEDEIKEPFIRILPTGSSNGCFIAVMIKKKEIITQLTDVKKPVETEDLPTSMGVNYLQPVDKKRNQNLASDHNTRINRLIQKSREPSPMVPRLLRNHKFRTDHKGHLRGMEFLKLFDLTVRGRRVRAAPTSIPGRGRASLYPFQEKPPRLKAVRKPYPLTKIDVGMFLAAGNVLSDVYRVGTNTSSKNKVTLSDQN
ncbi:putative methyltransferase NSUN7 [Tachypleus tridentatus]|uniref:putative methyltransferase NSUN7 n=1 Tax=Tachypleus tridentatus TaxID=6853 RepID=UPI003FD00CB9